MFKNSLIVYENRWIIEKIYEVSDKVRHKITDQVRFEERCIERIGSYLVKEPDRINNKAYIIRLIREVAKASTVLFKKDDAKLLSDMVMVEDDGDEVEFEPVDVLGNVESEVIVKEMTALLGKDGRRKAVLEAWTIGNTNDKSISSTLGRTLGGNQESHRKFIQRFRKECREQLSAVV